MAMFGVDKETPTFVTYYVIDYVRPADQLV